ncbi:MAG TPA: aldehyde ferredoxin oxidoreductase family protein, partial [Dehalococcoidales bacterium]|nr:aldehyde ferredoxin oxidoreductase family protein [Dehalococcoidales bacterium]
MSKKILGGYTGKTLRVDLNNLRVREEKTDEELCDKYLGGAGFISHYLWKELEPKTDPLGPDNKLIFATGPLTGLPFPGSGRNGIGAKSPLTDGVAKSEVGGVWGAELKRAGVDGIIIEGKSDKPVYLWIQDGKADLRDAAHIWGRNTKETQQQITGELGDDLIRVASIGPAGENLVKYACVMNGLFDAAGRGGVGAVMGAKNLKAIAVRGHHAPKAVDGKPAKELAKWLKANWELMRNFWEYGTGGGMDGFEAIGNLPVRNFRDGLFPTVKKIDAPAVMNNIGIKMDACFACPVRCKKVVKVDSPYKVDPDYGGPEYETLASIGSNCGIDNLEAIAKGNELCNAYSLDTISTGEVIAFAMECFENGLLSSQDTGGIDLRFGNEQAMLQLIEMIARREGIGDLLAEGVTRAARQIGGGAEQFAIAVKGLEPGMHDPRAKPGIGIGFMVNPHGADHCFNLHDHMYASENNWRVKEAAEMGITGPLPVEDISTKKVRLFQHVQRRLTILDSLVVCQFLPYNLTQLTELLNTATGWSVDVSDLFSIADRTLTTFRLFNLREGFSASDDVLPQ